MKAVRRSRIRKDEGHNIRGTQSYQSLSPSDYAALEREIDIQAGKSYKHTENAPDDIPAFIPEIFLGNGQGLDIIEDAPKEEKKEGSIPDPSIQPRKDT